MVAVIWPSHSVVDVEKEGGAMMKRNLQKPPHQRTKLHAISLGMFVATMALSSPTFAVDTDGDGTDDALDNCTLTANPDQRDSNGDGFGNACDADINDDGAVNSLDLGLLKRVFSTVSPDSDINGDGRVNSLDLGLLKRMFLKPPGPSNVTPDPALVANPPTPLNIQMFSVDPPTDDGKNGAVFVTFSRETGIRGTVVIAPEGRTIALNDLGIAPDQEPGDMVFSGFNSLDVSAIQADDAKLQEDIASKGNPDVIEFSGRDVISSQPVFQQKAQRTIAAVPIVIGNRRLSPITLSALDLAILPPLFTPSKTLAVTALSVVADPTRTFDRCDKDNDGNQGNVNGVWSFKTLMANMANSGATGISPQQFVHNWLRNWMTNTSVNGFNIGARTNIQNFFPGWDGVNATTLNLNRLPFRLLGIVNRMDLGKGFTYGITGQPGQTRFVFGLVHPSNCSLLSMTVIFEYGDPKGICSVQKSRAKNWISLSGLPFPSPAYNAALQSITDTVTIAGVAPGKPNGSAINQVRSNEIALAGPWQLREFHLVAPNSSLMPDTIKQTPNNDILNPNPLISKNGTADLASFMEQNANDILCEMHTVPLKFPGRTNSFLGAHVTYGFGAFWNANLAALPGVFPSCHKANASFSSPPTPMEIRSEVRHKFSLNTCDDCHSGETNTPFTHVSPLSVPASLSSFMTGIGSIVPDPAGSGVVRNFNDLQRRGQVLQALATQSCSPSILGSFVTKQSRLKFVH